MDSEFSTRLHRPIFLLDIVDDEWLADTLPDDGEFSLLKKNLQKKKKKKRKKKNNKKKFSITNRYNCFPRRWIDRRCRRFFR